MPYTVWSAGELVGHVAEWSLTPEMMEGEVDGTKHLSGSFYATPHFETIAASLDAVRARMVGPNFMGEMSAALEADLESGDDAAVVGLFERQFATPEAATRMDELFRDYAALQLELRDANGTVVPTVLMYTEPWPFGVADFPVSDVDRDSLIAQGVKLISRSSFTALVGTLPPDGAA